MSMISSKKLLMVLKTEQQLSAQLLEILLAEREVLVKSEGEMIMAMAKKKQPLTAQLEQLGRQRDSILQSEGFSANKEGLYAFVENQEPNQQMLLNQELKLLKTTALACRDNNQVNGGIVNVNRQYLHRAMSVLRGRDMNISSYGPGGEYSSQVVRQPLLGRV
jgi:flagella synthesis protein FlgN